MANTRKDKPKEDRPKRVKIPRKKGRGRIRHALQNDWEHFDDYDFE